MQQAPAERCDILIAGGGPVSLALAHALDALNQGGQLKVMQIGEAPPADDRPIALSWGSRVMLERMGCWDKLPVTPITRIHVSQQQAFGRTLICAADHAIEALGYVVAYRDLVAALSSPSAAAPLQRSRVTEWAVQDDGVDVTHGAGTIKTQLLVLADGGTQGGGQADKVAGTGRESVKEYGQSAIVCAIETEKPHDNTAWERFSTEGPLALLPFRDRYALVWTSRTASAERLMALDDQAFLAAAQKAFGGRRGAFRAAGRRAAFPLSLKHRHGGAQARVIPIGNAAQTLHPVAGQGLNLGLRDAWELAELIADADRHGMDASAASMPGSAAFAQAYARRRQLDRKALVRLTDGMISAFGLELPFASAVRGAALAFLDAVPPARRFLSRRMMFGARALP